jgi:hypothetical protein
MLKNHRYVDKIIT